MIDTKQRIDLTIAQIDGASVIMSRTIQSRAGVVDVIKVRHDGLLRGGWVFQIAPPTMGTSQFVELAASLILTRPLDDSFRPTSQSRWRVHVFRGWLIDIPVRMRQITNGIVLIIHS